MTANTFLNQLSQDLDFYLVNIDQLDNQIQSGDKEFYCSKIQKLLTEFKKLKTYDPSTKTSAKQFLDKSKPGKLTDS